MRVAILGTGKMGAAMAKRLASQGNQLKLSNRTREVRMVGELGSASALKLIANTMLAGYTR